MTILFAGQRTLDDASFAGNGTELQNGIHLPQGVGQVLFGDLVGARNIGVVAGVHIALFCDQGELGCPVAAVCVNRQIGHFLSGNVQLGQALFAQCAGGAGGNEPGKSEQTGCFRVVTVVPDVKKAQKQTF